KPVGYAPPIPAISTARLRVMWDRGFGEGFCHGRGRTMARCRDPEISSPDRRRETRYVQGRHGSLPCGEGWVLAIHSASGAPPHAYTRSLRAASDGLPPAARELPGGELPVGVLSATRASGSGAKNRAAGPTRVRTVDRRCCGVTGVTLWGI